MALMKFREPNQVKWQGFRPGHNGEQITLFQNVTNGTISIYTVAAGKTFYLTDWVFTVSDSVGGGRGLLLVQNLVPATEYYIVWHVIQGIGGWMESCALTYPIEIPTGWKIRVSSDIVTTFVSGFIHGWVE